MAAPITTACRLLSVLEEFVVQEEILLRENAFVEAVGLREQAAPVVEKLCQLADAFTVDRAFRDRLEQLLQRSGKNFRILGGALILQQEELLRVGEALGRLNRMKPAYKTARPAMESRLNAAA